MLPFSFPNSHWQLATLTIGNTYTLATFSKFFWKQQKQLVKTTSSFSPRNRAALLKPGAVAPG
jgi:hypothetical protein